MKLLTSSKSNIKMSTETSQSTCASWCTSWFPHCMHRFATILLNKPLPQDFPRCMYRAEDLFLAHWLTRVCAHQLVFDHLLCVSICQHLPYIFFKSMIYVYRVSVLFKKIVTVLIMQYFKIKICCELYYCVYWLLMHDCVHQSWR